jgi:peptidoglycan/xylan/chitin deacetylase (PgdA/CDA1 family)
MKWLLAVIVFLILAAHSPAPAAARPYAWPEGKRSAIVLTYDDSAPSQLQYAIPALNQAGFMGTFFLTGGNMSPESIAGWRAASEAGHELANHTLHHPCRRGTYDMPERNTSESYDVATMLNEIRTMNAFLTAIDGRPAHAFGAPCGHATVGGVDYYAPLIASGMTTFFRDEFAPAVSEHPPITIMTSPNGTSGAQLIQWVEQVRVSGALGVIVFHGVGGDHLAVSDEAHRELLVHLAAHSDIWVATFSDAMVYVQAH